MASANPTPPRLSREHLRDHLAFEPAATRRLVLMLREMVLKTAPHAAEAVKFRCLAYFDPDAYFGAIGGNICFIEVKRGRVSLSFVSGSVLPDPKGLLQGKGKYKRFAPVASNTDAKSPALRALVRAAAKITPSDSWGI
jgi:hypothetical protein